MGNSLERGREVTKLILPDQNRILKNELVANHLLILCSCCGKAFNVGTTQEARYPSTGTVALIILDLGCWGAECSYTKQFIQESLGSSWDNCSWSSSNVSSSNFLVSVCASVIQMFCFPQWGKFDIKQRTHRYAKKISKAVLSFPRALFLETVLRPETSSSAEGSTKSYFGSLVWYLAFDWCVSFQQWPW